MLKTNMRPICYRFMRCSQTICMTSTPIDSHYATTFVLAIVIFVLSVTVLRDIRV